MLRGSKQYELLAVEATKEALAMKAEVERLTSDLQMEKDNEDRLVREWQRANNEVYGLQRQVAALIDDQTRLKAEVERFKFTLEEERQIAREDWAGLRHENARLKAEVERLTKAGDLMCRMAGNNQVINRHWKTAKKGVQS